MGAYTSPKLSYALVPDTQCIHFFSMSISKRILCTNWISFLDIQNSVRNRLFLPKSHHLLQVKIESITKKKLKKNSANCDIAGSKHNSSSGIKKKKFQLKKQVICVNLNIQFSFHQHICYH